MDETYKASELIIKIQDLINQHGDVPVIANDPDTGYRLEIGIVFRPENKVEEYPDRFEIKSTYYGRPEGHKETSPITSDAAWSNRDKLSEIAEALQKINLTSKCSRPDIAGCDCHPYYTNHGRHSVNCPLYVSGG